MSVLNRLKNLLSGDKEEKSDDKKSESSESKAADTSSNKAEKSSEESPVKAEETKTKMSRKEKKAAKAEKKAKEKAAKAKAKKDSKEKSSESPTVPEEEKTKPARSENMSLLQKDENLLKGDAIDKEFSEKIKAAGGDSLEYCFQCGTCTGSCPSGRRTPYRIRQIVRKTNIGLKDEVIADPNLWMCTTCYACQERCPREIKIVDVVKLARNEAAKAGFMAPAHKMTGKFVIESGHGVPINDATMELRKRVGLGELPPTTHSFPEALEEVQTILKATGFDSLIGYNWESKDLE
jgi:heterodisulfide reductase subunit C2